MNNASEIKLRLFNVGQGDHLLLELPDGSFGIIDFFYSASKGWTAAPAGIFLENLRKQEPEREIKIAFICVSHPDVDHIKGIGEFLGWVEKYNIPVDQIWRYPGHNPGQMKGFLEKALKKSKFVEGALHNNKLLSPNLDALDGYIERKKPRVQYLVDIKEISNKIAGFVDAKCLAPLGEHIHSITPDFWISFFQAYLERKRLRLGKKNILSSVIQLIFGEFNLLFGGDTELHVWNDCMEHCDRNNLKISWQPDFIKISHHGSKKSSSIELWEKLLSNSITYIGISAWKKEHPHKETITHITQAAFAKKREFRVLGTSVCANCASEDKFKPLNASWVTEDERNIYDNHVLKKSRSKDFVNTPSGIRLISYVLTFSLNNPSILVEKEISATNFAQMCIYDNPSNSIFPQCIIE